METQRDVLSTHSTEARYEGTNVRPCMFRTSLCPDRCGHSRPVALFTVLRYLAHEKPGQYGDERQSVFHVDVTARDTAHVWREAITRLGKGQLVQLDWSHDYVTTSFPDGGESRSPERPVKLIRELPAAGVSGGGGGGGGGAAAQ